MKWETDTYMESYQATLSILRVNEQGAQSIQKKDTKPSWWVGSFLEELKSKLNLWPQRPLPQLFLVKRFLSGFFFVCVWTFFKSDFYISLVVAFIQLCSISSYSSLSSKHNAKHYTYNSTFNPHNNSVRQAGIETFMLKTSH